MKVVGLIAEYNPFHKGHQYHIEQAKMLTGADCAVVVMSGDFVQRGEPAIMPKHLRAKSALHCGADLVIELPVSYATGSAEQFAFGAVSILEKLGVIDSICFGSECGDLETLSDIANILSNESEEYKTILQKYLRSGDSFPLAREKTIKELLDGRYCVIPVMYSGGGFADNGDYTMPVQCAMLSDGEKILGKVPPFTIVSSMYDMFGKDFIGVGSDQPVFNDKSILFRVKKGNIL